MTATENIGIDGALSCLPEGQCGISRPWERPGRVHFLIPNPEFCKACWPTPAHMKEVQSRVKSVWQRRERRETIDPRRKEGRKDGAPESTKGPMEWYS